MNKKELLFVLFLLVIIAVVGFVAIDKLNNHAEDTGSIWTVPEPPDWPTEPNKDKG